MYALHNFASFQLCLGYTADAVGAEVGVSGLDTAQAAQVFVALLLPLGDQVLVSDVLLQAVLVQLSADSFAAIEEIINVA